MLPVDILDATFDSIGDKKALVDDTEAVIFAQLRDTSRAVAHGLQGLGVDETGVIGVPDQRWGEKAMAYVIAHEGFADD